MSKGLPDAENDMLEEYDFSEGVRGKYAVRYAQGTNLVLLEPDLAEHFPDSESVNQALRRLLTLDTGRAQQR